MTLGVCEMLPHENQAKENWCYDDAVEIIFAKRYIKKNMCVMMLWSSVAVNVGGWRRVAGMEVLATFTSQDPRSG